MASDPTQLQIAQIAAILGPDPTPFETLISTLMSTNNDQRSQAETLFNLCKQTHPDTLSLKLAHVLHSSPTPESRAMSAVLLRKLLTAGESSLYPSLSPATQLTLKSTLLESITRETTRTITKKLCDTISELASSILPENGWTELLPFMFQCVTSENPKLRESALLIFAQLAQYIGEHVFGSVCYF